MTNIGQIEILSKEGKLHRMWQNVNLIEERIQELAEHDVDYNNEIRKRNTAILKIKALEKKQNERTN